MPDGTADRPAPPAALATPLTVSDWLVHLADLHDDPAYRRAAKALLAECGGRPKQDDRAALAEVAWLVKVGKARNAWHACWMVAGTLPGSASRRSKAKRLHKKTGIVKKSSP